MLLEKSWSVNGADLDQDLSIVIRLKQNVVKCTKRA